MGIQGIQVGLVTHILTRTPTLWPSRVLAVLNLPVELAERQQAVSATQSILAAMVATLLLLPVVAVDRRHLVTVRGRTAAGQRAEIAVVAMMALAVQAAAVWEWPVLPALLLAAAAVVVVPPLMVLMVLLAACGLHILRSGTLILVQISPVRGGCSWKEHDANHHMHEIKLP